MLGIATICSCAKQESTPSRPVDTALRMISIVPGTGEVGSAAIISGINFTKDVEVMVGEAKAEIVSFTSNRIYVTMPQNDPGTYDVVLTKGNERASNSKYTYVLDGKARMTLVNMVPEAGRPGEEVAIYGQGFGDDPKDIKVKFGDAVAEVVFATRNIVRVKVPAHAEGDVPVTMTNSRETAGGLMFKFKREPKFEMISIAPTAGRKGSTAVITGDMFSPVPEENTVLVGTARATVLSASTEKLTIEIPDNPEGVYSLTLKVGGKETTGLQFTYLPKAWIINYFVGNGTNSNLKDGKGSEASVHSVQDMHFSPDGLIWMVCRGKHSIMTLDPITAEAKVLVTDPVILNNVWQGAFNSKGVFYAAVKAAGKVSTVTKEGIAMNMGITEGGAEFVMSSPMSIAFDSKDVMYVGIRDTKADDGTAGCIAKVVGGEVVAKWPALKICSLEMGPDGLLYWGSESNCRISCTNPADGTTTVIAGTGVKPTKDTFTNGTAGNPASATVGTVRDISFDVAGTMYFTEEATATLRKLVPAAGNDYAHGVISTIAGVPCESSAASAGSYDGLDGLAAKLSNYVYAVLPVDDLKTIFLADGFNYRVNKLVMED